MQKLTDLQELLKHELQDLYSAETQLIEALPKMAEKANNPQLKKAFTDHLKVTKEHQSRLGKIQSFFNMEKPATKGFFANLFGSKEGEEHCKAMEGLIKEADSLMEENMAAEVMDAALIAAAQKVEHYEISSYGTARAFATQLGFKKVVDLLSATLQEEYEADDSLTVLAVGKINLDAEGDKIPGSEQDNDYNEKALSVKPAAKKSSTAPKKAAKKAAPAKKTATAKKATAAKPAPKKAVGKSKK